MKNRRNNILIVDDEEVIRNICFRSLQPQGYDVTLAENAIRALDCLRKQRIDVVFSDFKMPMMDGIELLQAIKRDHPHVEVIIMTAYATIESAIHAMKHGAYDFILKPVKPDRIRFAAGKCFEKLALSKENEELRLANQKLEDVKNIKDKFIAITSHELRTPVSHLKGYLGILSDSYFSELSDQEKNHCMSVIGAAVQDLENIVGSMHQLKHLENGELHLRREKVKIKDLILQTVDSFLLIAKKRKHLLKHDFCEDDDCILNVDERQFRSVLSELIQNAIKFTPDGGEIGVGISKENQYCLITVRDNGIGIDESEHSKIFEKFYEVQSTDHHSSSTEAFMGGGLGLGLNSVRTIVEAHGGGVKVKSKKGAGAEFLVYLPLADE